MRVWVGEFEIMKQVKKVLKGLYFRSEGLVLVLVKRVREGSAQAEELHKCPLAKCSSMNTGCVVG